MHVTKFLSFLLMIASAIAFAPSVNNARTITSLNAADQSRKAFLTTAAAGLIAATTSGTVVANAASADYDLDSGDVKVPEKEKKAAGNGAGIVGGALAGGLALSLPFFLPNLLRMAGIKNAKS